MYLQGRLFGIAFTNSDKRSDMYDALSMYRPSEIILPEGTVYRKIFRILLKINFSNVVLSPFTTYYTQREVAEKAVNHFGDLGLMEEDVWGSIRVYASIFRRNYKV